MTYTVLLLIHSIVYATIPIILFSLSYKQIMSLLRQYDNMDKEPVYKRLYFTILHFTINGEYETEAFLENIKLAMFEIEKSRFIDFNYKRSDLYKIKGIRKRIHDFLQKDDYKTDRDLIENLKDHQYKDFYSKINPYLRL